MRISRRLGNCPQAAEQIWLTAHLCCVFLSLLCRTFSRPDSKVIKKFCIKTGLPPVVSEGIACWRRSNRQNPCAEAEFTMECVFRLDDWSSCGNTELRHRQHIGHAPCGRQQCLSQFRGNAGPAAHMADSIHHAGELRMPVSKEQAAERQTTL